MQLKFFGAAETVTGSRYLIEHKKKHVLVDCGLFQGHKELRLRNWQPFPVDPASIEAIILTHAHIDHSGYIPRLVKYGFKGKVYCSAATHDLCEILLRDCAHIQEEDAKRANRYGYTKHHPALPLYDRNDAEAAMDLFQSVEFGKTYKINDAIDFTLDPAGHILGAGFATIYNGKSRLLFSGDIGRMNDPIMEAPADPRSCDYLVLESTYGNRKHEQVDPRDELRDIIKSTVNKGGSVLIPAFAVGRAQSVLYYIHELHKAGEIPHVPVYLDSPMAIDATKIFFKHRSEHRLSDKEAEAVCGLPTYVRDVNESKELDHSPYPNILISASGMATGGRVLHHLKQYLGNHANTVLFAGFQAGGTRGDRLVSGEREVKIHGKMYPVKARIENLDNMSAHGDYTELISWVKRLPKAPKKIFITHGELSASEGLAAHIEEELGWPTEIPKHLQSVKL